MMNPFINILFSVWETTLTDDVDLPVVFPKDLFPDFPSLNWTFKFDGRVGPWGDFEFPNVTIPSFDMPDFAFPAIPKFDGFNFSNFSGPGKWTPGKALLTVCPLVVNPGHIRLIILHLRLLLVLLYLLRLAPPVSSHSHTHSSVRSFYQMPRLPLGLLISPSISI
jgi:hypothetical protein